MNQLPIPINTDHVVIFHDGSEIIVTSTQADEIFKQSGKTGGMIINRNFYNFKSISKVVSMEEYYRQYPEKIPHKEDEYKIQKDERPISLNEIIEGSQRRFKGILIGLKQYIDEELKKGITPKNAIALYNERLEKYKNKFSNICPT